MSSNAQLDVTFTPPPGASTVNRRILRAAAAVTAAGILVKLVATGKEIVVAALYGRSDAMDAFLAAFLIPNLLVNLIAESMNQALIPTLIRVRLLEGRARARQLLSQANLWLCALLAAASVLMAASARLLFPLIASNFAPSKLALSIRLFYALLPCVLLGGIASNCTAVLNSRDRFALPALAPALVPIAIAAGSSAFHRPLGIWALVLATLAGMALHAAVMAAAMRAHGYDIRIKIQVADPMTGFVSGHDFSRAENGVRMGGLQPLPRWLSLKWLKKLIHQTPPGPCSSETPETVAQGTFSALHPAADMAKRLRAGLTLRPIDEPAREVARQFGPVLLSSVVASGGLLVDQAMAAMLPAGSVSALVFAGRFVSVAMAILAGSISSALTPAFSTLIARRDWPACRAALRAWSRRSAVVSAPVAFALIAFARPLVRLTLQHGAFAAHDTAIVAPVLAMSAFQIPFYVVSRVPYRFIVAMRRTGLVFACGLLNLALDIVLNLVLMRFMGLAGIALATSLWTVGTWAFLSYCSRRLLAQASERQLQA